jgi:AraC family transcriptional activator FtrA
MGNGRDNGVSGAAPHRVAIVVLETTQPLDLAVAIQAFGRRPSAFRKIREERGSPYEIALCGTSATVNGSHGLSIGELHPVDRIATSDTVLVPGLDEPGTPQDPRVLDAIARAADQGARLVSLCTGAFVLAQAGVLAGRRVTTHWALADEFRSAYPAAKMMEEELYIDDGQVLSSGGMLAGADLCLYVLRQDLGQSYANDVARLLVSPPYRSGGQTQYAKAVAEPYSGSLAPVIDWMLEHLDQPLSLRTVAEHAHVSTRTLARRFRAETGQPLMAWIATRRVDRVRALLEETDLTITQIAHAAGFGSSESLRRHFIASAGTTPRAYRETFQAQPRPDTER